MRRRASVRRLRRRGAQLSERRRRAGRASRRGARGARRCRPRRGRGAHRGVPRARPADRGRARRARRARDAARARSRAIRSCVVARAAADGRRDAARHRRLPERRDDGRRAALAERPDGVRGRARARRALEPRRSASTSRSRATEARSPPPRRISARGCCCSRGRVRPRARRCATSPTRYANVENASAPALLLLADLQVDDGDLAGAAQSLAELARRHPTAEQAPLARFRGGLLALERRCRARRGAVRFAGRAAIPNDEEAPAARYWAARAHRARGPARRSRSAVARDLGGSDPLTYYGVAEREAARRVRVEAAAGRRRQRAAHRVGGRRRQRVRALQLLGMDVEARSRSTRSLRSGRAATAAEAARSRRRSSTSASRREALRLAVRTIERGGAAPRALLSRGVPGAARRRAAGELARGEPRSGARRGTDPAGVDVESRRRVAGGRARADAADAVGRRIDRLGARLPGLESGAAVRARREPAARHLHLASGLRGERIPTRALAAYNAGASRVTRWSRRPGASDPELFAEWIPFVETRDYVRVVVRESRRCTGVVRILNGNWRVLEYD